MQYLKNKRNDQLTQKPDVLKGKLEKYILINLCKKTQKDKTPTGRVVEIKQVL